MAGFSIIIKTIMSYDYLTKVTTFNILPRKREVNANASKREKKNTGWKIFASKKIGTGEILIFNLKL